MERKIRIVNEYGAFSAIEINKAYVECREYIKHYKEVIEKLEKKISELESELAVKEDLLKTVANRYDKLLLDSLRVTRIDEDINCGEEPLPFSSDEYEEEPVKVNLNDNVKVKLTPYGAEIYYHQYDELNKQYRRTVIEPHMPKIDKDGYTKIQLHHFMNLYGEHIRMCNKNVIEPLDIILCD